VCLKILDKERVTLTFRLSSQVTNIYPAWKQDSIGDSATVKSILAEVADKVQLRKTEENLEKENVQKDALAYARTKRRRCVLLVLHFEWYTAKAVIRPDAKSLKILQIRIS
jgi:predicted nucleic acid-binding protein